MATAQHMNKEYSVQQNTQLLMHKHLYIQFYAVITKLTQEIDELAYAKEAVRAPLHDLQKQLNKACSVYCANKNSDLIRTIEKFHQSCHNALTNYKKCPKIRKALRSNGIPQETIDTMLTRFSSEIQSAIYYTLNHTTPHKEEQSLSPTQQLFMALSARIKQFNN